MTPKLAHINKITMKLPSITALDIDEKIQENIRRDNIVKIGRKNKNRVCYNYALDDDCLESCEEAMEQLLEYYKPIPKKYIGVGDIISFHLVNKIWGPEVDYLGGNSQHFAIVSDVYRSADGEVTKIIIKSKFGMDEIFEGDISMLPKSYGNRYIIWRRVN